MRHFDLRTLTVSSPPTDTVVIDPAAAEQRVLQWARHPVPGSVFARWTWAIRRLPDTLLMWELRRRKYGAQILFRGGAAVGHIFHQEHHGCEAHMFSIEVDAVYRSLGYGNQLMRAFLLEMGRREHIEFVRLGAGNDGKVMHMWGKTVKGEYDLPYTVTSCNKKDLGWLRIVR